NCWYPQGAVGSNNRPARRNSDKDPELGLSQGRPRRRRFVAQDIILRTRGPAFARRPHVYSSQAGALPLPAKSFVTLPRGSALMSLSLPCMISHLTAASALGSSLDPLYNLNRPLLY